ncbi:MAG: hypothetical protein EZS28_021461 [Streblomastix strix]|uniref:DUF4371 domain-containing protein n=1 Tax=Streblomastix strix TaxID=222440 RepID=A0A5J4VLC4_9EUKA|nr:MAG: hypothetical protein EZS28_021461 [Streblomastix strix]
MFFEQSGVVQCNGNRVVGNQTFHPGDIVEIELNLIGEQEVKTLMEKDIDKHENTIREDNSELQKVANNQQKKSISRIQITKNSSDAGQLSVKNLRQTTLQFVKSSKVDVKNLNQSPLETEEEKNKDEQLLQSTPQPIKRAFSELNNTIDESGTKRARETEYKTPKHKFSADFLTEKEFLDQNSNPIFRLTETNGEMCKICEQNTFVARVQNQEYILKEGRPDQRQSLRNHIKSNSHSDAIGIKGQQQNSPLFKQAQMKRDEIIQSAADQIQQVYWLVYGEKANDNSKSLQELFTEVTKQSKYTDFGHTSYEATYDIIRCISDFISIQIKEEIKLAGLFGLCIDESTDVSSLNQFSTFIRYIGRDKQIHTSFLDIRPLSS